LTQRKVVILDLRCVESCVKIVLNVATVVSFV